MTASLDEIIQKINCHSAPCDLETIIRAFPADIQSFFSLSSHKEAVIIQDVAAKRLPTLYAEIDTHHNDMRKRRQEESSVWAKTRPNKSAPIADNRLATGTEINERIVSIQHQIEREEAVEHRSHTTWEKAQKRLAQLNARLDVLLCRAA